MMLIGIQLAFVHFFLVIKHFYLVLYLHFKLHLIHYRMSNRGKILKTQFPYRTTWTYIFPSWFEYVFLHDPSEFFNSIVHFLNKLRADCKQVFLKMIIGIQLASVHFFLSIKFFFWFLHLHCNLHLIHYGMSNGGKSLITQFAYRSVYKIFWRIIIASFIYYTLIFLIVLMLLLCSHYEALTLCQSWYTEIVWLAACYTV